MLNRTNNRPGREIYRRVRLQVEELESREMPSSTLPSASIDSSQFANDHILVRWLNDHPVDTSLASGESALGNSTYDVKLAPGVSVSQAVAYYSKLAGVDFAQPDYIITAATTPNDTYINYQWALSAINTYTAWNYTTGSKKILVAVVDTGVDYTDTDLAPNMVPGYDFANNDSNPMDDNGHGTHVAGIIGAVGNNATGVAGVNWNVQIMPLKFMAANGQGYLSNAVLAVNYAVQMGAKIINNSWGGGGYDSAMASAIQNAQAHGVIFVAAAGNNASNNDAVPEYPANYAYSNVVSVAATDQNNNLASFSDYGAKTVTIAAPGVSILSTLPNNTYAYYSGTSMATPYVTGALALVWSLHPEWTYTQVIADVLNNTDRLASLNGKVATGLLDVGKAVAAAAPPPATTPTTPVTPGTFSSGAVNLAYTGAQTVTSSITVNQHLSISALTATVNLQNTYDQNVQVTLVGPNGQQLLLFNRRGGTGSNLTGTTFSDTSPNAIYLTKAPFTGTVRPEYALSAFKSKDAYGTWKLIVTSTVAGNAGKILNWSLGVATAATTPKAASIASEAGTQGATVAKPVGHVSHGVAVVHSNAVTWVYTSTPTNAVGVVSNVQAETPSNSSARQSGSNATGQPAAPVVQGASNAVSTSGSNSDEQTQDVDRMLAALFVKW